MRHNVSIGRQEGRGSNGTRRVTFGTARAIGMVYPTLTVFERDPKMDRIDLDSIISATMSVQPQAPEALRTVVQSGCLSSTDKGLIALGKGADSGYGLAEGMALAVLGEDRSRAAWLAALEQIGIHHVRDLPLVRLADGSVKLFEGGIPEGTEGVCLARVQLTPSGDYLGTVSADYAEMTPEALSSVLFDVCRAFNISPERCFWGGVGASTKGRRVGNRGLLVFQTEAVTLDTVRGSCKVYGTISAGFGGQHGLRGGASGTLAVCQNTSRMAAQDAKALRHTGDRQELTQALTLAVKEALGWQTAYPDALLLLDSIKMSRDVAAKIGTSVYADTEGNVSKRSQGVIDAILDATANSPGADGRTALDFFQGLTYYDTHLKDVRPRGINSLTQAQRDAIKSEERRRQAAVGSSLVSDWLTASVDPIVGLAYDQDVDGDVSAALSSFGARVPLAMA